MAPSGQRFLRVMHAIDEARMEWCRRYHNDYRLVHKHVQNKFAALRIPGRCRAFCLRIVTRCCNCVRRQQQNHCNFRTSASHGRTCTSATNMIHRIGVHLYPRFESQRHENGHRTNLRHDTARTLTLILLGLATAVLGTLLRRTSSLEALQHILNMIFPRPATCC